jgi:hypothetical protein
MICGRPGLFCPNYRERRILKPVSKRATLWIFAAFLSLCAAQAVPAVRVELSGATCSIVWIAQARAERRVVVEKSVPVARRVITPVLFPREFRASGQFVSQSYRQRPPPFSLS